MSKPSKWHPEMPPSEDERRRHSEIYDRQARAEERAKRTAEQGVKKGTNDSRHASFRRVQSHIADQDDPRHPGSKIGEDRAAAILAARSRGASAAAKRRNPNLKKVSQ